MIRAECQYCRQVFSDLDEFIKHMATDCAGERMSRIVDNHIHVNIAAWGKLMSHMATLEAENKIFREALESVFKLDKSREYDYGQADRNGNLPGVGQRWKTPKEIARSVLEK